MIYVLVIAENLEMHHSICKLAQGRNGPLHAEEGGHITLGRGSCEVHVSAVTLLRLWSCGMITSTNHVAS